ncbi:MAG: hypothetical protein R3E93_06010 [Thiothrix sp.]
MPAGDGEYDPSLYQKEEKDVEDVWKGVYHEEGAFLYGEWDYARQHYRKNWCVLREIEMTAGDPAYVDRVQEKYQGLSSIYAALSRPCVTKPPAQAPVAGR